MSGSGRRTSYRKSITDAVLYGNPEVKDNEVIAKVKASRGSNIFEIELPEGQLSLALLPSKYHKLIWIKRGDYVIVSGTDIENDDNNSTESVKKPKLQYIIEHILYKNQIRILKKENSWPKEFQNDNSIETIKNNDIVWESNEDSHTISINRNRQQIHVNGV